MTRETYIGYVYRSNQRAPFLLYTSMLLVHAIYFRNATYFITGTLRLTYNALGKSIASYAAPVLSANTSDSSYKKIQTAQNATGSHNMASIDHLHQESLTLKVQDHSDMLTAQ